ncbi:MAG TPA: hypothetical protein VNA66_13385, partial [Gammaproteobacteria bacterium]|nr:hypothetical protein [Gammaproteobacteria bacterium]
VPNYVRTNRHERANPTPVPAEPLAVSREVADALAGRWVGRPRIATLDLDLELAFSKQPDGAVVGRLVGTTLGAIDAPLRNVRIEGRELRFDLPNWQPWVFAGEIEGNDTIVGVVSSEQGGVPVTFRRRAQ